jgi:hypothetical protein
MRQGSIWVRLEKKYRLQQFDLIYDFKKAWCCLVIVLANLSGDAPHWGDKTDQKYNFTLKFFFYIQETTEKEANIYL